MVTVHVTAVRQSVHAVALNHGAGEALGETPEILPSLRGKRWPTS